MRERQEAQYEIKRLATLSVPKMLRNFMTPEVRGYLNEIKQKDAEINRLNQRLDLMGAKETYKEWVLNQKMIIELCFALSRHIDADSENFLIKRANDLTANFGIFDMDNNTIAPTTNLLQTGTKLVAPFTPPPFVPLSIV